MRKIRMNCQESITFEEGCNLYLQNCKERNLREDTIRHYRQSCLRFYRYFDRTMPLREMTLQKYNGFVEYDERIDCWHPSPSYDLT